MPAGLSFSVVVASWRRPKWLARCLAGLRQLDHPAFEVIVVADAESLGAVPLEGIRTVEVDVANLSAARNAGVAAAGGDVCAFIDDDAVPEPMWLRHHEAALLPSGAAASAGFVRGRNGISFQSRAASIDREAETHAEPVPGEAAFVPDLAPGRALKLVGTNAAVRRDVLCGLGGFDPAFAYFLEDADLSLRLGESGFRAVAAPLAEVHHGFAPSSRRTALRAPTDLYDIGRSSAVFFRRHPGGDLADLEARIVRRERARLIRHMVRGTCEPRDVGRVMATLEAGWRDGMAAELAPLAPLAEGGGGFRPLAPLAAGHRVLAARLAGRRRRLTEAERLAREGNRVSLFSFSLTPVRHRVRFTEAGVWAQTGGQFGRSERSGPRLRWCRFANRTREEILRVAKARGISEYDLAGWVTGA